MLDAMQPNVTRATKYAPVYKEEESGWQLMGVEVIAVPGRNGLGGLFHTTEVGIAPKMVMCH